MWFPLFNAMLVKYIPAAVVHSFSSLNNVALMTVSYIVHPA